MIQENYCSFEQAKALKELGFPQDEPYIYLNNGEFDIKALNKKVWFEHQPYYACPTLSLVQKWLREEKDLIITIGYYDTKDCFFYELYEEGNFVNCIKEHETYEQALSAGIDKCIELLKQ